MAIAFNAITFNAADGTGVSFSHTAAGSDRHALIGVYQHADHTISAISYGAQTPTLVATVSNRLRLYRLTAPNTGAQTVSVTSNTSSGLVVACITHTGVDQTTPVGTFQSNENSEQISLATPAITSSATGLIVDFVLLITGDMTPGGGQTQRLNVDGDTSPPTGHGVGFSSFGVSEKAGSASVTTSWSTTETFGDNRIIGIPLIAAAGGGASQAPRSSGFMRMLMNN